MSDLERSYLSKSQYTILQRVSIAMLC